YLYFFIQLIFFWLYGIIYCGDACQWLPAFALPITNYATIIVSLGTIFMYLFFNSILNTRQKIPAASRAFFISAALTAIGVLFYFAGFRPFAAHINALVSTFVFLVSIILCFYLKKAPIIRLIFIGFVVGFVILLFWLLMLQNIVSYYPLVNNLFI